ncbi:(R)-mandelonitrile lyase [Hymenobacter arizonensis]|uniref:Cupin domain protein n=1 Tax=Hymenobacter arizonensis TaxID=1227077 RepID=A0A1I6BHC8_HYMAR|nr:cupin domain-containing protein [Hymenobacter arizonensis]SFQ80359.1 Cupin domain protein [Hymenobacter arizonensis]
MKALSIYPRGSLPPRQAPEQNFTGDVAITDYFERPAPSRLVSATVTFAPGARTPWKVNPLGQTLLVTHGVGWAQGEGEAVVEIRAGDIVWCPPGQRHWDGATPEHALTYIALQEAQDGRGVVFGERVTDEEYRQGPSSASSQH